MRSLFARIFRAQSRSLSIGRRSVRQKISASCEMLESRKLMSTYYVSAWGNDGANGQSQNAAWKSIGRVNGQQLRSGDTVLFQGSATYYGSVQLMAEEGGVNISSYGNGRATINSGGSAGLDVGQTAGVHVWNMNFRGNGMYNNNASGIWFHANWGNRQLYGVQIDNVDVSGYGDYDVKIEAPGGGSGYNNVRISDSTFHDSKNGGIWINGSSRLANKNVYIGSVWVWNHPGDGSTGKVTGNGIAVFDTDGAIVERSVVHDNGQNGAAPVGIWTAGSNRITFQYNESFNNKTMTSTDGGGFDFDWDVTNSTMQYNYSHDNHGPGYLIAAGSHVGSGNTIRYNVSQNDARRNARGAIELWGNVTNTKVYSNTVYLGGGAAGGASAFFAHNNGAYGYNMSNLDVRNNILYTTNGQTVLNVNSAVTANGSNRFMGNDYYAGGNSININWNGGWFSSLNTWQNSTGQEKNYYNQPVGYFGDPKLQGAGQAGTLNHAGKLNQLWQYKLQGGSPVVNRGVSSPNTLSAAGSDFFGGWLLKGGKNDIGANEAA